MGALSSIKRFFSIRTETTEGNELKELQTRYYKTTKDKAMQTIENVLIQSGWEIARSEEERGEIVANMKKGKRKMLVLTIITVKPFKTAVDLSCSTDTVLPTDFGHSRKVVVDVYNKIDRELTYIGSSLGNELL
ncbi:DUF1499 domain-containing protein [Halalkalibacter sp. APA_J-10(15)]|uniref:DUF1499 domain-containing protein n=1 Tax=unclassified Halalkalibacter TaxID=2893063 RepID=UPI001FF2F21E|nr:DUF1499 domain-containing protein [Halalkalibacter sp. APA_J-10(15)]MCK0471356.1 DUF1499 domain-containing protein [Halalkalibacter sp. APA_J-10(15)]